MSGPQVTIVVLLAVAAGAILSDLFVGDDTPASRKATTGVWIVLLSFAAMWSVTSLPNLIA